MKNNSKLAAVISYITWIGWVVALVIRDPSDRFAAHHINQALVINILEVVAGVFAIFPLIGGLARNIVELIVLVFWILGIYRAATGSTQPLPLIGDIHLID